MATLKYNLNSPLPPDNYNNILAVVIYSGLGVERMGEGGILHNTSSPDVLPLPTPWG